MGEHCIKILYLRFYSVIYQKHPDLNAVLRDKNEKSGF